jgi:hypothetical protein
MLPLSEFHLRIVDNYVLSNDLFLGLSKVDKDALVFEFIDQYQSRYEDLRRLVDLLLEKNPLSKLNRQCREIKSLVFSKIAYWTYSDPETGSSRISSYDISAYIREELFLDVRFLLALISHLTERVCSEWRRLDEGGLPEDEDVPELMLPQDDESAAGLKLMEESGFA